MKLAVKVALAVVLVGPIPLLAAWLLRRCRHRHEIWRRSRLGVMGLECWRCGRWRMVDMELGNHHAPRMTAPVVAEARCEDVVAALEHCRRS